MARQLPAGMRNNNPGNIKYVGQPGTHPSVNTDQGDPQAVFASPEAGMSAMHRLLTKKYRGGKMTADQIIAGQGGWTPGNHQAAANVARSMGIEPNEDIRFTDPVRAAQFMRALMLQEHGEASRQYTDAMINNAVAGGGAGGGAVQAAAAPIQMTEAVTDGPKGQEVYTPPHQYGMPPAEATTSVSGVTAPYEAAEPASPFASPVAVPALAGMSPKKSWMENLGAGIGNIKMAQPKIGALPEVPGAARMDAEAGVSPLAPRDPNRMALAQMMMQRLNSGKLF